MACGSRTASHPDRRCGSGPIDPRWFGIGDAAAGLCGGMSWFVRERFEAGLAGAAGSEAPANGSPLFRALVRRQVLSLDWLRTPLRFWWMGAMGSERALRRTWEVEWPRIRADIDAGRLAMVGLVRHSGLNPFQLTQSHQVLAYAYEVEGDAVTLRIYDPNWPGRDDVALTSRSVASPQVTGENLLGYASTQVVVVRLRKEPRSLQLFGVVRVVSRDPSERTATRKR